MGLAAGLSNSVIMDTGLRGAFQRSTTGFYAAESGLNKGMGQYRNIFLSLNKPTGPYGNQPTMSVGSRTVTYGMNPAIPGADGNAVGQQITIPAGQLFAGLSSTEYTLHRELEGGLRRWRYGSQRCGGVQSRQHSAVPIHCILCGRFGDSARSGHDAERPGPHQRQSVPQRRQYTRCCGQPCSGNHQRAGLCQG